jgi:hypothetical protein
VKTRPVLILVIITILTFSIIVFVQEDKKPILPFTLMQEDTSAFLMKGGIRRTKILSNLSHTKNEFIATLFTVEDTSLCNFRLISRKNFSGYFYDSNDKKYHIGNKNDNIDQYTNMLIIYRKAKVKGSSKN